MKIFFEDIFYFLFKYQKLLKVNIDITNFKNNLGVCKENLISLFKNFFEILYDEKDDFFDEFFNLNKEK